MEIDGTDTTIAPDNPAPNNPERVWRPPAFAVGWELQSDRMLGCAEIGAVTARVVAIDAAGRRIEDLFDCEDGAGITGRMRLGRYDLWVDILDRDGFLLAQSAVASAVLGSVRAVVPVDFRFPIDSGFLVATWSLSDEFINRPLSCAEVGVDRVSVLATRRDTGEGFDHVFDCRSGTGFTERLPLGVYTVVVSLLDGRGGLIEMSTPIEALLDWGNKLVDLGNFDFLVR